MGDDKAIMREQHGDKEETTRTSPRFTVRQMKVIDTLIGAYGKNRSDVVKTLVIMWLTDHGHLHGSDPK